MLKSDTLGLRLSTIKEKLNTLSGLDELTDEQRNEADALTVEYSQKETMWRAAKVVEGDEQRAAEGEFGGGETLDGEARERREIRNKTGFRDYLVAACSGAPVAGAAAEFNTACGVAAGDHVPRELFEAPARERRQSEHRAVTPGPAIDGPVQPVVPYLFEASVISTLGLIFPSVPSGIQQVPAITTAPPADALDEGGAAPSTAAAYTLASRSPKRISGQIEFSVEDLAVHPALESDLSMALQGSMSNQLDETAINGNNAGGDLNGLFQQATNVTAGGTTDTFTLGLTAFAALVDGRYSRGMGDLRGIIGSSTFGHYMGLYHGGSGDMTLYEKLAALMGSLVVSDRMPAVAGGAQKGLVTKNTSGQPIRIYTWDSLQLIRDPYSGAGSGKVTITAIQLVSDPFVPHGVNQVIEVNRDLS